MYIYNDIKIEEMICRANKFEFVQGPLILNLKNMYI